MCVLQREIRDKQLTQEGKYDHRKRLTQDTNERVYL